MGCLCSGVALLQLGRNLILRMKKTALISAAFLALPFVAFAQGNLSNIQQLIVAIGNIVALLIPIMIGVAMLVFFYGLVKYVQGGEGVSEGKNIMIGGIIALFIMVSIWGIIRFAQASLGIGADQNIQAPHFPTN